MSQLLKIEIVNWEKFNPKRDQKSYTWLRLNNDFITDPELFGLDAEQKLCWIEILCQASKKNAGTIVVNIDQLSHISGVHHKKILQLIEFLTLKPIIKVHDRTRPHDVVTTTPTYVRTNETNERDERTILVVPQPVFDLEIIFKEYPKRLGNQNKKQGIQRLTKFIKNDEDFNKALQAVQKYKKHCVETKKDNTPYVKQFGTFFDSRGDWLEWVEFTNSKTQDDWKKRMMEMLHD